MGRWQRCCRLTANLTCTDCHDPHGSSNYRLLKAQPNPAGPVVGGYTGVDGLTPNPFVFSDEQGYPVPNERQQPRWRRRQTGANPTGGWLKHAAGAAQMALYRPNYTDTQVPSFCTPTPLLPAPPPASRCRFGARRATRTTTRPRLLPRCRTTTTPTCLPWVRSPALVGTQNFHRHPIDQTLAAGADPTPNIRALTEQVPRMRHGCRWSRTVPPRARGLTTTSVA